MKNKYLTFTPKKIVYLVLFLAVPIFLLTFFIQLQKLPLPNQTLNPTVKALIADSALAAPALLPIKTEVNPFTTLSKAVYVVDVNSMSVLYGQNQDTTLPMASIAKMMTALLAIEHYSPNDWLTVDGVKTDGSNIGLISGEQYQMQDLLGALLVGSANDAAEVLASNFTDGLTGFVWGMNQKALELGMKNTHFVNPIGFDHPDQYSTARDLTILAIEVMKHPLLAAYVSQKEFSLTDSTNAKTLKIKSTNELLSLDSSVLGIKTGWTEEAGECLIVYANRDNHPIISVILGSSNRFEESETLINWIYQTYQWKSVTNLRSRV